MLRTFKCVVVCATVHGLFLSFFIRRKDDNGYREREWLSPEQSGSSIVSIVESLHRLYGDISQSGVTNIAYKYITSLSSKQTKNK